LARAGNKRLAQGFEGLGFLRPQCTQRHALGARRARGEQNFGAADREGKRAEGGTLHELAPFELVHDHDPPSYGGFLLASYV
jgi:hypothetical protein